MPSRQLGLADGPPMLRHVAAHAVATRSRRKQVVEEGPEILVNTKLEDYGLNMSVVKEGGKYKVYIDSLYPRHGMMLHWAVDEWGPAPQAAWPEGTRKMDEKAVQSPFQNGEKVVIVFDEANCPNRIVFVLKETQPEEKWTNCGGSDFLIPLKAPEMGSVFSKVIEAESSWTHYSLFQRFVLANEVLDSADAAGPSGMAFFYAWFRLSQQRHLDWYRNTNYQSKDIAHVQKHIAERVADKARSSKDPYCRMYARLAMEALPRGGGNGDDIRMGILNIMRANGIKEGHRPGLDEPFLEQWHQKLHTNTTPDDVAICEAYLAFLHSNNHDDYWRVLWERGQLTKERLAQFSKPLTAWPMHLPHLINPIKGFLWTLKITHSGADLDTAFEMSKGYLDDELRWWISDLLQNRHEWWVPGKVVEIRLKLQHFWKAPGASRDLLLLDLALDNWLRMSVERVDKSSLNGDSLIDLCALVLRNTLPSVDSPDLQQSLYQLEWVQSQPRDWGNRDWALAALATCQRCELSLSAFMDKLYSEVQPHAETFGKECKIDPKFIANFGEEVVRAQPAFMLSLLLQHLEPMLRGAAGVSPWQVVSQGGVAGAWGAAMRANLADIQGQSFVDKPTVLLAESVGGMEDIPLGVQAVLTRSATDVLSHVAIRARSQNVLLATCFDEGEWRALTDAMQGKSVHVTVAADGSVRSSEAAVDPSSASGGAPGPSAAGVKVQLAQPKETPAWCLPESAFAAGLVGAKSLNLKEARGKLPAWISAPASAALPFTAFGRVLGHAANAAAAARVGALQEELAQHSAGGPEVERLLGELREVVGTGLAAPPELVAEVAACAQAAGMVADAAEWAQAGNEEWPEAWASICRVWASKWGYRAWLSRRACGVPEGDLHMAVLLQQVVPAEYAFVLHTANPVTGAKGELFGEVCVGMGESLVGNRPGRALSFVAPAGGAPRLLSLPSKPHSLHAPEGGTLIARSDANGEDLEGFAGAGLYDSVPFFELEERAATYSADRILTDGGFRAELVQGLAGVGAAVKEALGGQEQDVEGCWAGGKFWVVQSRPQVL